jgi:hypothetical protein
MMLVSGVRVEPRDDDEAVRGFDGDEISPSPEKTAIEMSALPSGIAG